MLAEDLTEDVPASRIRRQRSGRLLATAAVGLRQALASVTNLTRGHWGSGPDAPDSTVSVDVVGTIDPVADEQRPVRPDRDTDGSEVLVTDHDRRPSGTERGPSGLKVEAVNAVVAPGRDEQGTTVRTRQAVRLVDDQARRRLARAGDHRQHAGQIAVPGGQGVEAAPAVAEAVAVVAALHDMEQPAGWPRIGVIVHGEESAKRIERLVERIPEAGSHPRAGPSRRAGVE